MDQANDSPNPPRAGEDSASSAGGPSRRGLFNNRVTVANDKPTPVSQAHTRHNIKNNNSEATRKQLKVNTDHLDDAMKELLDICQQYNDKLTLLADNKMKNQNDHSIEQPSQPNQNFVDIDRQSTCDIVNQSKQTTSAGANSGAERTQATSQTLDRSDSIEKLLQRQTDVQTQLDEATKVARSLASKQSRHLKCIIEDDEGPNGSSGHQDSQPGEDDDELVEFQQIENELRLSELNRQLNNIQEELRMRLYKRLLSNTHAAVAKNHPSSAAMKFEAQIDSISPSSSVCSDAATCSSISATYSSAAGMKVSYRPNIPTDDTDNSTASRVVAHTDDNLQAARSQRRPSNSEQPQAMQQQQSSSRSSSSNRVSSETDSANTHEYEDGGLTSTTSKDSFGSSCKQQSPPAQISDGSNPIQLNLSQLVAESSLAADNHFNSRPNGIHQAQMISNATATTINNNLSPYSPPIFAGSLRNSSVNSDLERIEEDEEDSCQDYYGDSNRFRAIYEEKLSPMIQGRTGAESGLMSDYGRNNGFCSNQRPTTAPKPAVLATSVAEDSTWTDDKHYPEFAPQGHDKSSNVTAVTAEKRPTRPNRPLTLYMPKPDEEIDLVDHVQALGHDLDIVADDLKVDTFSASGYLYKCSCNSKKWLKRYFHFDRRQQVLNYYESHSQFVKRPKSFRNCIPFDDISDVYVDHARLGKLNDESLSCSMDSTSKDSSSKKKRKGSYVFVLATIGRKYLLASPRAETMRVWIDILFTAAKANDYLEQLTSMEAPTELNGGCVGAADEYICSTVTADEEDEHFTLEISSKR